MYGLSRATPAGWPKVASIRCAYIGPEPQSPNERDKHRRGWVLSLLDAAEAGRVRKAVVAYCDGLARFRIDLLEHIFSKTRHNTRCGFRWQRRSQRSLDVYSLDPRVYTFQTVLDVNRGYALQAAAKDMSRIFRLYQAQNTLGRARRVVLGFRILHLKRVFLAGVYIFFIIKNSFNISYHILYFSSCPGMLLPLTIAHLC